MSVGYVAVQWNRHKRVYDLVIATAVIAYILTFVGLGKLWFRGPNSISDEILVMRAFGTCAYIMLHVVLCIGPMCRLNKRFLPLLYNRRHLGVATFLIGEGHAALAVGYYHGFGKLNPLVSLIGTNTNFTSLAAFPFQLLGLAAWVILFLMAATSHDFWLKNLGQAFWKKMHMLVYVAYALLVMHVALGALQTFQHVGLVILVVSGAATVVALHLWTGFRESRRDGKTSEPSTTHATCKIDVGSVDEIPDQRGRSFCLPNGQQVAVFRYSGKLSAISNVCAHQGGPLGEGKIIDGCVTCPWHGWQYRPGDGQSPPPFVEKLPTYHVSLRDRRILIDSDALPPGTPVQPAEATT